MDEAIQRAFVSLFSFLPKIVFLLSFFSGSFPCSVFWLEHHSSQSLEHLTNVVAMLCSQYIYDYLTLSSISPFLFVVFQAPPLQRIKQRSVCSDQSDISHGSKRSRQPGTRKLSILGSPHIYGLFPPECSIWATSDFHHPGLFRRTGTHKEDLNHFPLRPRVHSHVYPSITL